MAPAKLWLCGGVLAIALSACGTTTRPVAGSPAALARHGLRGKVDDPRTSHYECLLQHHIVAAEVGQTEIQIDTPPGGPTVVFEPTPGAAQAQQITGQAQGAEVIGSALLYPNGGSDNELGTIETCVAKSVKG